MLLGEFCATALERLDIFYTVDEVHHWGLKLTWLLLFLLLLQSFHLTLPSTFLRFSCGLMLFSPEGVKTCLVDNVTESGKFVLQRALPDELVQL